MTHDRRPATDFGLGYMDLKRSARTSIEHSFLPGADLWAAEDDFTKFNSACAAPASAACAEFLKASEKAQQQWELERRFKIFEAR